MKVLIISGFLGAGKTTLIKKLSKKTDIDFAVMENEYGEVGIDGKLLKQDRLKVWELTEGCICCSLKSDFASSVLTIANAVNPEYLIVEPSGVGMLSSVLFNLAKIEYEHIRLLQPITVIDIHTIATCMREFSEIFTDQIKYADTIFISKAENISHAKIQEAMNLIKSLNPAANVLLTGALEEKNFNGKQLLQNYYSHNKSSSLANAENYPDIENSAIENFHIQTIEELIAKIVLIMRQNYGAVYRGKGFVCINGQWTKFDIVGENYTIETCEEMDGAKAVFIGRALKKDALRKLWQN